MARARRAGMIARLVVLAIFAILVVLGGSGLALAGPPAETHVIPPGREAAARALLDELGWGVELGGGYRFDRLAIERSTLRLILVDASDAPVGQLKLSPRGPDTPIEEGSESFAIAVEIGAQVEDERVAALLGEAAASVRAHDHGGFHVVLDPPPPEAETPDQRVESVGRSPATAPATAAAPPESPGRPWLPRVALILALGLAGATISLWPRGAATGAGERPRRLAWVILGLGGAFAYLVALTPEPMLHMDTARDLLIARDLAEGRQLHLHGVRASFAGLRQGLSWLDLLALVRLLGGGAEAARLFALGLQALAVVLGVIVVVDALGLPRARLGRGEVALLAVAMLWLVPWLNEGPILWQMAALPVAVILVHAALLRVVVEAEGGRILDAAVAGSLAGLALDLHVVCVVLLPWVVGVSLIFGRRPLAAALASALAMAVAPLVLSIESVAHNLGRGRELLGPGALAGLVLVAVVGVLASLWVRRRAAALDRRGRLWAYALAGSLAVALMSAAALLESFHFAPRYLSPLAFTVILALGLGLLRGSEPAQRERAGRRALAAGLAFALLGYLNWWERVRVESGRIGWRIVEVERLALTLQERGWTLDEASAGLAGTDGYRLLTTLAVFMDEGDDQGRRGLVILREAKAGAALAAAYGGEHFELDHGRAFVLLTGVGVDRREATCCVGADPGPACVEVELRPGEPSWRARARPTAWLDGDRLEDWIRERRELLGEDAPRVRWRVQVAGPGAGAGAAVLTVTESEALEPGCGWRVVAGDELLGSIALVGDAAQVVEFTRSPACLGGESVFPPAQIELEAPSSPVP